MNKTETLDGIKIIYKKHPFSKSIKITLKQEDFVLVTMPYLCPYKKAREFLMENFNRLKSFKIEEAKYDINFKTQFDTLRIIQSETNKTLIQKGIVYFYFTGDILDKTTQKLLMEAHLKALKIEAKNYLPQRLSFLASKHGFNYNKVFLKNQKTRFGSCSYCNNINLNINLMRYSFDIIDYVLIHELVHTKIKNHSKSFWLEVEKYCPNYKDLRRQLKR